jgi:hypothetical protein
MRQVFDNLSLFGNERIPHFGRPSAFKKTPVFVVISEPVCLINRMEGPSAQADDSVVQHKVIVRGSSCRRQFF